MFRCSAFSLTEVMFAVIVLGIGFIMVAAMFPVSISQSRLTVEETSAAAIARNAMANTTRLAENGDSPPNTPAPNTWGQLLPPTDLYRSPPTALANASVSFQQSPFGIPRRSSVTIPGKVLSCFDVRLDNGTASPRTYRSNLWNAFKGSLIIPSDNRYAWVPLYRRDVTYYNNTDADIPVITSPGTLEALITSNQVIAIQSSFAQVYFLPVAVRNRTLYDTSATSIDVSPTNPNDTNLLPRLVQVDIVPDANTVSGYILHFLNPIGTPGPRPSDAAAEGAFVVISDDRIISPKPMLGTPPTPVNINQGRMNGRIYRLGSRRADLDTQQLGRNYTAWELAPGSEFSRDPGANGKFFDPLMPDPADNDDIVAIGNRGPIANINGKPTNSQTFSTQTGANAFIVGRNTLGAGTFAGSGGYEGPAQDIAAFVTFVKVN